jgi:hypothetical protein
MELESIITYGIGLGAVIAGAVIAVVSRFKGKRVKKTQSILDGSFRRDLVIQEVLTELRVKINADRVYLCLFHNGGLYFDGTAIKKVSRTHESCRRGSSHETINYQNIPTSLVFDIMRMLEESNKTGRVSIRHTEELDSGFLKSNLINLDVKVILKYRLKIGMRLVGYLGAHYLAEGTSITEKIDDEVHESAGAIENILASDAELDQEK